MLYHIFNKFLTSTRRFSSFSVLKRGTMDIEKCYFRYTPDDNKIDITFLFKVKHTARQFNMSRNPTEKIDTLLFRLANNVQKVVDKSNKKKKNTDQVEVSAEILDNKNIPVDGNKSCLELFEWKGPFKLVLYDREYSLVFNLPWVVTIDLPLCNMVGFNVYPEHFKSIFANKENTSFAWYCGQNINENGNKVNSLHIPWELVARGHSYIPSTLDIGKKLKLECTPGNNETQGPTVEVISKNAIEAGPGSCPFETRQLFTKEKLKNKSFRCVSYNILADLYCDSDYTRTVLHPYCPPYALHIDYRKQLILKELLGYNADIICLQEVDRKIFNHYLCPHLSSEGYEGLFYIKGKEVAEGLACFYRTERYRTIGGSKIWLSEAIKNEECLKPIWNAVKDNTSLLNRLLDRSNVASASILESQDNPDKIVLVANTHLYFHPDADHIRLLQGGMAIYWLKNVKAKLEEEHPNKRISLILCGDFNSVPSCGVYQLYTTGIVPSTNPDWKSNLTEAVTDLTLTNDVHLESACGTPQYTNFTAEFADCLDYIYYEKSKLNVIQVIPFPSIEELKAHTALPSMLFPSDHIALIADLQFK